MRSRVIFCSLILAGLGWTSGHAASTPNPRGFAAHENEEPRQARPASPEVKWRVLGLRHKSTDDCPNVDGWDVSDWLQETLRNPQDAGQQGEYQQDDYARREPRQAQEKDQPERPQPNLGQVIAAVPLLHQLGLDRVCAYMAIGPAKPFPTPLPSGLESAETAQMALVPAGEDPDLASAQILAQHFIDQTNGMPQPPPVPGVFSPQPPRVRLVFLDTQPDHDGVPHTSGRYKHGYTLVHLADHLVCPQGGGSCRVELATRLALPYPSFSPEVPPTDFHFLNNHGGQLGLVDELAAAIVREVVLWHPDAKRKHLILNLSLGWDGERLHELDKRGVSQLRQDTGLVYKALQLARESGALVIAAAGNRRGGGESQWPLLPAAWEMRRPSLFRYPLGPTPVYAVGGVDWQGLPLANYRIGGLPQRVAFGDHALATTADDEEASGMYTGSSVSTAVVSAIAAVVWQLRPELSAAEVMRILNRSGEAFPSRADYYAWRDIWPLSKMFSAPHLKRLTLCQAVVRARQDMGMGQIPSCRYPKQAAADLSVLVKLPLSQPPAFMAAALPSQCASASHPTPRLFIVDPDDHLNRCPLYSLTDMVSQRWVSPQPDEPPCPGCSFVPPRHLMMAAAHPSGVEPPDPSGYVLVVDIDASKWHAIGDTAPGDTMNSATLDVDRYSGDGQFANRTTYSIRPTDLLDAAKSTKRLLLSEVGNGDSLVGCTATLNLSVTVSGSTFSVQNPIYVDP